jgi:hypothetical protein
MELTRGEHSVPSRSEDVSDGRIDDGGFGRTADLIKVREELGEVLISEVNEQ